MAHRLIGRGFASKQALIESSASLSSCVTHHAKDLVLHRDIFCICQPLFPLYLSEFQSSVWWSFIASVKPIKNFNATCLLRVIECVHQGKEQLSQNGRKTAQELSGCVTCYLQIGSVRLFLTRVHIPGPPFANHFVPLCHTHLPCCQCPTACGEVTTHFSWQEEIISLRTAGRSPGWLNPERFLQQRIARISIGINKLAADTRPGPAHTQDGTTMQINPLFFGENSLQEVESLLFISFEHLPLVEVLFLDCFVKVW